MAVATPSAPIQPDACQTWWTAALAGAVGSLSVLAVLLTLGVLAFAPLGADAARVGVTASFFTAVVGGLVYGLSGRAALPAAGPSSATALILATLVAQLLVDPAAGADADATLARVLTGCALAVALAGVLQMLLAVLGLARLTRLVPQPVLAGFMNGVALVILFSQVPLLAGQLPDPQLSLSSWPALRPAALLLGLGTAVLILVIQRRQPTWPATLLALLAGALACALLQQGWPALDFGLRLGVGPMSWPLLSALSRDQGAALAALQGLQGHATEIIVTALVLALVGSLESALNLLALDQRLQTRHEPRRELLALGLGNLASGLLGGLPVVMMRARALAIRQAGGQGSRPAVAGSLALLLLFTAGAPLLTLLPLPVLGGVMLMVAYELVDKSSGRQLLQWWRGQRSGELRASLLVMLLVCAVTLWQGFTAGVGLGLLLSMAIFIWRMNRSLLRSQLNAAQRPSRRVYPPLAEARLKPLRSGIQIWELEGAVFFGNADRLLVMAAAIGPAVRALVLDLRRVTTIDETGAAALANLGPSLHQRQVRLLVCGLQGQAALVRTLQAADPALELLPDADRAIETAEQGLLGPVAETTLSARPLTASDLLQGLNPQQVARVCALMSEKRLFAGETLFRQGDAADGLYVLALGSVSVIGQNGGHSQRFLSISPGMMIGETAMLDGGGRTAAAVADTFVVMHHLGSAALQALDHDEPAIAARLYRNVAVHLSARLRAASLAWAASQA